MSVHVGEKPFGCDICRKRVTKSATAKIHEPTQERNHSVVKFVGKALIRGQILLFTRESTQKRNHLPVMFLGKALGTEQN